MQARTVPPARQRLALDLDVLGVRGRDVVSVPIKGTRRRVAGAAGVIVGAMVNLPDLALRQRMFVARAQVELQRREAALAVGQLPARLALPALQKDGLIVFVHYIHTLPLSRSRCTSA